MNSNNICKFVLPSVPNTLTVYNFVLETNKNTMKILHKMERHRAILVTVGNCTMHFNKTVIKATAGDIVFGFSGESFLVEPEENAEYMYICFDGIRSTEIFNRLGIDSANRIFSNYHGIIPLWKEGLSYADNLTIDLTAESILLYTFSKFTSEAIKQESIVGKMVKITKERFSSPSLSIDVLSQELSYNSKYLSHVFKAKMNMGYSVYLRNMRLKFAISLFDNGINIVKNVALLSGFSDPLYFSTIFKKTVGVTPKEYIRSKLPPT